MLGMGSVCLKPSSSIWYPIVRFHSKLYSVTLPILIIYVDMFFISVRYRIRYWFYPTNIESGNIEIAYGHTSGPVFFFMFTW